MRISVLLPALTLAASVAAKTLDPLSLIQAPRPGVGIASPTGHAALWAIRSWNQSTLTRSSTLYALHLPNHHDAEESSELEELVPVVHNATSAFWISPEEAAYIIDDVMYVKNLSISQQYIDPRDPGARVGHLPAEVTSLRVARTAKGQGEGTATLVFSAEVYEDGSLNNVKARDDAEAEEWSRVKSYENVPIRHWNKWLKPGKRSQLFSLDLTRNKKGYETSWLFAGEPKNLLNGTRLGAPVPPFGDESDYAVSAEAGLVAFTAKDPAVNAAWHTRQHIYTVPLDGSEAPRQVTHGNIGATSSPEFSPDGNHLAWLQMARDGFESDVRVVQLHNLETKETEQLLTQWDRSPSSLSFAPDGENLYLVGEDREQIKLWRLPVLDKRTQSEASQNGSTLQTVIRAGGVGFIDTIPGGGAVITKSSMRSPADLFYLREKSDKLIRLTDITKNSLLHGLDLGPEPYRFNYTGAEGRTTYGWIIPPPGYDRYNKSQSWPLLTLIHGGPEGSWENNWNVRWNPETFAAAGFFTIALDPAGSTGFGKKHQEDILGSWGGRAFYDIRAGVHHILQTFDNVDAERVVAAGASFGGYSINWIQGHNEDGLFKGLVSHDGVFSTLATFYSTDELYFPEFEFGGVPWVAREGYERWNPERFTGNWNTPQLTIAGRDDFRLPESEGISVFNTLQRRGVPSKLLVFQEGHWVVDERNSLRWYTEVIDWLKKYSAEQAPESELLMAETVDASEVDDRASGLLFQHQ
ncbi:Dipeptidyl aminopeptidase [Ceraceosorus bombacis]|uniref:Dipeptidyl-peptidase V n=1 Tax=Ceraceosorus bombacis TaxID=401625 RepID=A0A0P1B942_9BASI|nr:Dipeptidyl aminopeptidase [Ceraceosorus bombacis]